MATITAEARKHLITRSTSEYKVRLRTFSMKDGSQGEQEFKVSGDFSSDMEICAHVSARYTTQEIAVVPVALSPVELIGHRFAMYDDRFVLLGHVLKDGEKLTGLMVRTITITEIFVTEADFVSRTFSDKKLSVYGTFDSAQDALAWYVKRNPNTGCAYIASEITGTQEVKIAVPVQKFFDHAFALDAD